MMKNLTLEHIAAACHGTYYGPEEKKSQCIEAVTTDSRKIEKNCLFVPIVGARADGHKFIDQVMEQAVEFPLYQLQLVTIYNTDTIDPASFGDSFDYDGFEYALPVLK